VHEAVISASANARRAAVIRHDGSDSDEWGRSA
jgi:hypothetical protein